MTLAHAESNLAAREDGETRAQTHLARPSRKVFVIAYRFPPQGGGGVQRTLKFVKYLPQCGWLPVVHTVSNPYWPLRDATLLSEVPPCVKVYRTPTFEFERFGRATEGLISPREHGAASRRGGGGAPPKARNPLWSLCRAIGGFVQRHVLVPDPQVAWIPVAFLKSLRLIRKERASLIYTSSPPNSSQVLGLLLKRAVGLPWIADFRDPWTEGIRRKQAYERSRVRRRVEEALERAVIGRADHVVVTTDKTLEQFLQKYPSVPAERYSVITNGFDPADFSALPAGERLLSSDDFNLTLTGNVEAMFDAAPFLSAVKDLIDEEEGIRARLKVNFIGTRRGKYDDFIRERRLENTIRYVGYVPHQVSLCYLAESAVLFLCQIPVYESATTKLSGKLFEYLYMRKPILALTLPGLTSEILARSGLGVVVDPNDRPGIKKALRELYLQWREGQEHPSADETYIAGFDRTRQTERLAGLFDRLAERRA